MVIKKLTNQEYAKLSTDQKKDYDYGIAHINDDWAVGPYGGWSRAIDALKKVGYIEKRKEVGHRVLVRLVRP